ncbi:uncharacterized protein PRCAT00005023001 [Priceomyces carsonii]|uniref:uncharacterized protein n=1 Tax=Priceomyces carsonii TaxID=28549 RepID=UPI002ED79449|nr:unnamed protein product [Priceomyces carsonii]
MLLIHKENSNESIDSSQSSDLQGDDANGIKEYRAQSDQRPFTNDASPTASKTSTRTRLSFRQQARTLSRVITGEQRLEDLQVDTELPPMGSGIDMPPIPGDEKLYLVSFDGPHDPIHPHNWSLTNKIFITSVVTLFSFCNSLGSALLAESNDSLREEFHVGSVVATLATSLYVLGFACGPMIWGPLSELYGRKAVLIPSTFGLACFSFAVATAKDLQTIMICRFFSGFSGGAAMVISASTIADLFNQKFRGRAMAPFGISVCGGPCMAPIISAFTEKNLSLGWRWNAYWSGISGSFVFALMLFFFKETYQPIILVRKAEVIRRITKNWTVHAPHETLSLTFSEIAVKYIARPFYMLFTEPILFLFALYGAFIYGIIYLLLTAIPLIFLGNYHFAIGVSELPYISVLIGCICGGLTLILFDLRYRTILQKTGSNKPMPKERLPAMMVGSFSLSGGLFWLCWSGDYADKVHWIVPTIGGAFVGFGFLSIFQPCINYIVDSYLTYSASALAAMTVLRSIFGGVFPLFAHAMFTKMHIKWAGTLLGCISILLVPVPFLFYKYDDKMRARSRLATLM